MVLGTVGEQVYCRDCGMDQYLDIALFEVEDDEEEIEEDDEPAKVSPKQLAELKKALNTYAGKKGRPKAVKILHKYAKVSHDVKASDFPKIMEELKI
mgnify:CR=1 FL=1